MSTTIIILFVLVAAGGVFLIKRKNQSAPLPPWPTPVVEEPIVPAEPTDPPVEDWTEFPAAIKNNWSDTKNPKTKKKKKNR